MKTLEPVAGLLAFLKSTDFTPPRSAATTEDQISPVSTAICEGIIILLKKI
jgi:hypothetical protein